MPKKLKIADSAHTCGGFSVGMLVWTVAFDGPPSNGFVQLRRKIRPAQAFIEQFVKDEDGRWYAVLKWDGHLEPILVGHLFHKEEDCQMFCLRHNNWQPTKEDPAGDGIE